MKIAGLSKIRPCKCGGEAELEYDYNFRVRVICKRCGAHTAKAKNRFLVCEDWEVMNRD